MLITTILNHRIIARTQIQRRIHQAGACPAKHQIAQGEIVLVAERQQCFWAVQSAGRQNRVQRVDVRHPDDVPAVAGESGGHVLAEAQASVARDADVIVVEDTAATAAVWMII